MLVGDSVRNSTDSPRISCNAAVHGGITTVKFIGITHWYCCSLTMMAWEISYSLAIRCLFFFMKALLTLSWIWLLYFKIFQFLWINNSVCSLTRKLCFFWVKKALALSQTSLLKVEFDPLEIEPVLLEFWSWPKDMTGVMLWWTVFVESAYKLVNLQRTVIYEISSLFKGLKTHLVR